MKIILDAMGGDNAPQAIVEGALEAHAQCGADIVLVGREEAIRACLTGPLPEGVEIVNATEVVDMCDDPATAFKRKKDSSLTVGLNLLKAGAGDAFVSAGSTGALLAGATLLVKRIRGIRRLRVYDAERYAVQFQDDRYLRGRRRPQRQRYHRIFQL